MHLESLLPLKNTVLCDTQVAATGLCRQLDGFPATAQLQAALSTRQGHAAPPTLLLLFTQGGAWGLLKEYKWHIFLIHAVYCISFTL